MVDGRLGSGLDVYIFFSSMIPMIIFFVDFVLTIYDTDYYQVIETTRIYRSLYFR